MAVRRSVLPTSRGHAFESLAQWALSATTVASLYIDPGGHWLDLDVPSTRPALRVDCGAIAGGATETHGDLW